MQLSDILEGYWLARRRDLSKSTVDQYSRTFDRLAAYLADHGEPEFEQITAVHIRGYLDQRSLVLAKKTLCNEWVALSALWTWATSEIDCRHIIREQIPRPRFHRQQPEPYTADELRHMLDACDWTEQWHNNPGIRNRRSTARRDRAILLVLVDTGLRASELCALKLVDFDRRTGRLAIQHGKGDKPRAVYLGQAARSGLWRYLTERTQHHRDTYGGGALAPNFPLFATGSNRHLTRDNLLHTIQRIAARAGVQAANIHRFRHTFAINFLRNGGNIYALQDLLGHSDLETVRIYLKLADLDLSAAMHAASPADNWRL